MKANLAKKEPEIMKMWEENGIYQKIREKSLHREKFVLHDGPPYSNGHIHIGHALNKILKDIIIRSKFMLGYDANFVPGWDCHGLPIEHEVDKTLGEKKKELSPLQIRNYCRQYAKKYMEIQKEEFKRLGVFGDWDNAYCTMDNSYEATIVRELGKFFEKGAIYKGKKPVHWCFHCKTALAEAEVEYELETSPSIYVKFPLLTHGTFIEKELGDVNVSVLIWTTTPWTLPANLAICLHPSHTYVVIEHRGEAFILAEALLDTMVDKLEFKGCKILMRIPSKMLEGLKCRHPFMDKLSLILLGPHVTLDVGTGCVHTAPGHGQEDYEIGLKHGLEIYTPVDEEGRFTKEVEFFAGQLVFEANSSINQKLRERGAMVKEEMVEHSYPHCWRCKNPVIFRSTEQWFLSLEAKNLRNKALRNIKKVAWIPPWGMERIYKMVENRPDWCISRQRYWGVPITVFYCTQCGQWMISKDIIDRIADIFEKEGADAWFSRAPEEFLPAGIECSKCGGKKFEKEMNIVDVWFDSAVSFAALLEKRDDMRFPSDLYLEGSDQYRGWFHSSLLASVGTRGIAPYKKVLTHGFVVDGRGRKMSKSLGNVISPHEIVERYGADVLRLWVAAEDYRDDIRLSEEILTRLSEAYRRIRNTCRFMLGNLYDFNVVTDKVDYHQLTELDRWILDRLQALIEKVRGAFERFEFHIIYHAIHSFCVVELSSFYLDVLKDRLYVLRKDSRQRRSAQTTIFQILDTLVRLLAPILPFTAEEVWEHMPLYPGKEPSVHLTPFPSPNQDYIDKDLEETWDRLLAVRAEVYRALEMARKNKMIGHSLDAQVNLISEGRLNGLLEKYCEDLKTIFIVSQVNVLLPSQWKGKGELYESQQIEDLAIEILRAEGQKCKRCWNYSKIPRREDFPDICDRCVQVLSVN